MTTNDSPPPVCPRCGTSLPSDAPEGLCPRCLAAINFETGSLFTGTGASLPPPPIEEIAPHFPQLEILSCLGRGGMGVVYKARQISLDRLVALKLLAPEREKDPEFSDRFAREAQALAKMSHPHIVTVHDFGQAGGFFYLLMEYVDGANLRQLLQSHKFTPEQALTMVPPLCDALQYAHDRGIVHRDIKPENLLMDRDGKLKVADFGLAKMLGTTASGDERPVGTPAYMAPEQTGDPVNVDNRADIYSLGVVIYEMLTGELPGQNFQPPSSKAPIDARLDDVVRRAMETEPDRRYQQASILKTEVERISQVPPAREGAPPLPEDPLTVKTREDVRLSAIAMMIASSLSIVSGVFAVLVMLLAMFGFSFMNGSHHSFGMPFEGRMMFGGMTKLLFVALGGWMFVSLGLGVAALVGANRMRKFESYPWAMTSAIILIVMGVLSLPGIFSLSIGGIAILAQLAAGIWGLVVLLRPEVKAEFAKSPPPVKIDPASAVTSSDAIKRKLAIPSIGLMATAGLNLLFVALLLLAMLGGLFARGGLAMVTWPSGMAQIHSYGAPVARLSWMLLSVPFVLLPSIVTFIGAWRMREMKGYALAIIAAALALVTPPGLFIGVIFGIWALVVLLDKDVRAAFQQEDPNGQKKGCLIAAAVVAGILVLLVVIVPIGLIGVRFASARNAVPVAPPVIVPSMPVPLQPEIPSPPAYRPVPVPQVREAESAPQSDDLTARYEASRLISDFTVRDLALAEIAKDAAAAKKVELAKQALRGMSDFTRRDDARKTAAIILSEQGMRGDAVEIAKQISDFVKRDATMRELSTRKPPLKPEQELPEN